MQLFINGQEVSFTLENETTLEQVIESITEEVKKHNGTITSILVNDKTDIVYDMSLSDVKAIHVEADQEYIAFLHQCETAQKYLQTLIECIKQAQDAHVSTVDLKAYNIHKEDIEHFALHIDEFCFHVPLSQRPIKNIFLQIITVCSFFRGKLQYNEFAENMLYTIIDLIEKQITRVRNPQEYIREINEMMIKKIPEIEKISEIINTGKEDLAINYIIVSTDLICLWIEVLTGKGYSMSIEKEQEVSKEWDILHKKFVSDIQPFLVECADALEVRDWVTVGDIMEYEIAPKIKIHTNYAKNYYSSS